MLGLRRGTVKLVPHHKGWSWAFEVEKKKLKKKLGKAVIDIQHIGSTAIAGMYAKPILDMSAGVKSLSVAKKLAKPLASLGYNFYKTFSGHVLFAKGPDAKRTHYLHFMRHNGSKWKADLLFRDYLRTHSGRARAYVRLKLKLAKQFPSDREWYTVGKDAFIKETLRRAR
ncbi:MAG: GrpB family protein [Patescibacteria group bacterium]|mgnify:CR=1 FL=1